MDSQLFSPLEVLVIVDEVISALLYRPKVQASVLARPRRVLHADGSAQHCRLELLYALAI